MLRLGKGEVLAGRIGRVGKYGRVAREEAVAAGTAGMTNDVRRLATSIEQISNSSAGEVRKFAKVHDRIALMALVGPSA